MLYSMFSPFLTQRTKGKFVIAKEGNVAETLYKSVDRLLQISRHFLLCFCFSNLGFFWIRFIRPEDVPVQYGGLNRPSDLQNGPPKPASEFAVKGGEKVNIQIEGIEVKFLPHFISKSHQITLTPKFPKNRGAPQSRGTSWWEGGTWNTARSSSQSPTAATRSPWRSRGKYQPTKKQSTTHSPQGKPERWSSPSTTPPPGGKKSPPTATLSGNRRPSESPNVKQKEKKGYFIL